MGEQQNYRLGVNGREVDVSADDTTPLLYVLRHQLGLAGPRFGCGVGLCGACFVLMDGSPTPSCDTPMWSAAGRTVVTVEGLADSDGTPHQVQQAFLDEQAAQCGFCVSGILVSAAALLAEQPDADESAITEALDRNLCRCGSQRRMVAAVRRATKEAARS